MLTSLESISKKTEEFNAMQREYHKKVRDGFKDVIKEFFEAYPNVNTIFWNQYAPGFNDGDPCTFNVNEIGMSDLTRDQLCEAGITNPDSVPASIDLDGDDTFEPKVDAELGTEAYSAFNKITYMIYANEDMMEDLFDGNAAVVLDKDGAHYDY